MAALVKKLFRNSRKSKEPAQPTITTSDIKTKGYILISIWMQSSKIQHQTPKEIHDLIIKYWYHDTSRECRIGVMICGPHGVGKTTVDKHIRRNFQQLCEEDIISMIPYIRDSIIDYIKLLCHQSQQLYNHNNENTHCEDKNQSILSEILNLSTPCELSKELVTKIKMLWEDRGIKRTLALRHYYQIHDNVDYFLDHIDRIADTQYIPSWDDYLRIQTRSTGFASTKIETNPWISTRYDNEHIIVIDVGGVRSERKKWLNIDPDGYDIFSIIFVVAIGDYDLNLFEDNSTNRLMEAFNLFNILAERGFFDWNKIYLLFNKYDKFRGKIGNIPITVALSDYPLDKDPNDEEDVVTFIAGKFRQCLVRRKIRVNGGAVDIHRTNALNDESMKIVLDGIFNQLIQIKEDTLVNKVNKQMT